MSYNYSKLRGRIKEKYETQENLAKKMGLSKISLSKKLNNKIEFKQDEIKKMINLLEINENEVAIYFFNKVV